MTLKMPEMDKERVKEISEDILKSMLARGYPAVNASHYFRKYTDGKTLDPQFMHALAIMDKGKIIRIDKTEKPFSVTFVLLENGKPKMHHMIDDDFESLTFGNMLNDPYEGDNKRKTCYKHLENGYTEDCEKCEAEKNSQICMAHFNILSECEKCKKATIELKTVVAIQQKDSAITAILEEYKKKYWSYSK